MMQRLKIKVCGMRDPQNIEEVIKAQPDYIGFIFYSKSKRFVDPSSLSTVLRGIPKSIKKVGVFVNETQKHILATAQQMQLDVIQLHGQETPTFCQAIKDAGFKVFKAFSVDDDFHFELLKDYQSHCDYFLFDTKGKTPGGTGQKFNWQILENYQLDCPFFLSGGIRPSDIESIKKFQHPQLFGVDINSGFETEPALKDAEKVKNFISEIHSVYI